MTKQQKGSHLSINELSSGGSQAQTVDVDVVDDNFRNAEFVQIVSEEKLELLKELGGALMDLRDTGAHLNPESISQAARQPDANIRYSMPLNDPMYLPFKGSPVDPRDTTKLIEILKVGELPHLQSTDAVRVALDGLYRANEFELLRQAARQYEIRDLLGQYRAPEPPFSDLSIQYKDVKVLSLKQVSYKYQYGGSVPSYQVKIELAGQPITLTAPANTDFDKVLDNLYECTVDLKGTQYFKNLKNLVFDPGLRPVMDVENGNRVEFYASADADDSTGTIRFFNHNNKGSPTAFDKATFFHEFAHLIANDFARINERNWNPFKKADFYNAGEAFNRAAQREPPISSYAARNSFEAFAEAFSRYMMLDFYQMRKNPEQVAMLNKLGIQVTVSPQDVSRMHKNLDWHPRSFSSDG
jgi:hypothetical protein